MSTCCPRCRSETVVQMDNKLGYCWECKLANWLWTWTKPVFSYLETQTGSCPTCGAPVYGKPTISPCSGGPATVTYSCTCNLRITPNVNR